MQGVLVPAKTPKAIVDQLNAEIVKAMAMPDVKAKCAQLGFDPVANTPAGIRRLHQERSREVGQRDQGSEDSADQMSPRRSA